MTEDNLRKNEAAYQEDEIESIPVGPLGLVPLKGMLPLTHKIDEYLVNWRRERESRHKDSILFAGYQKDSFIIESDCPRFGSGESKGVIKTSVRGDDLYFLLDVTNYSILYPVGGMQNHYSPDDHFQDLKRVIAAAGGRAKRMTVIMPYLYEGRQEKREERESLDCAQMLKELTEMGVTNIITFDAHDPRVQNAIPLYGFETVSPTYQYIKALLNCYSDLDIDSGHMMIVSPDENGMSRAIYFANVLGLDMGMFYQRRDYSRVINDHHPVVANEFLGSSVEGKDVIIVDDMISSGDTMVNVARELKKMKARRVFCCASFGLFTGGIGEFDKAYEQGYIDKVFTTNLIYQLPELLDREWYVSVDMSKYIALMIDYLNHDYSISSLLNPVNRINRRVAAYKERRAKERAEAGTEA